MPLALLYSSLTKLFLLALLAIWGAPPPAPHHRLGLLDVFADGALDRAWVVRNVLGGMSAGFGLRGAPRWSFCDEMRLMCALQWCSTARLR